MRKPVIAAINGVVAGVGVSLTLISDIRIASENARFTVSFIKRGLIPDSGATYLLPRLIEIPKALELMWTGDILNAKEAKRFALRLAKGPSKAIELTKWEVQESLNNDCEHQLDFESRARQICLTSEDFKEGVKSFQEKREAKFQGC